LVRGTQHDDADLLLGGLLLDAVHQRLAAERLVGDDEGSS
jgi:hypothetical protein